MSPLNREDARFAKEEREGLACGGKLLYRTEVAILVKISLVLFLVFWLGFGAWLLLRFEKLFGYNPDDPAETPGARSLNQTQIWSLNRSWRLPSPNQIVTKPLDT